MSKRGLVPLFLAIGLGVGNGIWVFSPAFKERNEEKEELQKAIEAVTARQGESGELNIRDIEAEASRVMATRAALKADTPRSWWPSFSSTETNAGASKPQDKLPTQDDTTKKDNR